MLHIEFTDRWRTAFSGGHVGVLLMGNIDNSKRPSPLDEKKRAVEKKLRDRYSHFTREDFSKLDIFRAYRTYYKKFDNTYHVQAQLESVAKKGKPLPSVSPLVDANFAAELETLVLSAGHDADTLEQPLVVDVTKGGERFFQMNGAEKSLKPKDIAMSDAKGVICTILYGQDKRTPISLKTRRVLYVSYAPVGVTKEGVRKQLETIRENVQLFASDTELEMLEIFSA